MADLLDELKANFAFLDDFWACRLIKAYGTEAKEILANAREVDDLGQAFGATLTAKEVTWLIEREYARTAEDVVWRRSKMGLRMSKGEIETLNDWMNSVLKNAPQLVQNKDEGRGNVANT